jgi:hypothetical protein
MDHLENWQRIMPVLEWRETIVYYFLNRENKADYSNPLSMFYEPDPREPTSFIPQPSKNEPHATCFVPSLFAQDQ